MLAIPSTSKTETSVLPVRDLATHTIRGIKRYMQHYVQWRGGTQYTYCRGGEVTGGDTRRTTQEGGYDELHIKLHDVRRGDTSCDAHARGRSRKAVVYELDLFFLQGHTVKTGG